MAIKVFVVDDAKCLHELADALTNEDVAPVNHASTTNKYGAATYTQYGHVIRTHESTMQQFSPLNDWTSISDVQGKAVGGEDGYYMAQAIKSLLTSVSGLQLPTGVVLCSDVYATGDAFGDAMGYGTWELLTRQDITYSGNTVTVFYFKRTA